MKKYKYSESFTINICWDKTQMLKKSPSDKIKVTKNALFSFYHTVWLLILDFRWDLRLASPKESMGFLILDSVLFLLKFIFLFNKKHGLFWL